MVIVNNKNKESHNSAKNAKTTDWIGWRAVGRGLRELKMMWSRWNTHTVHMFRLTWTWQNQKNLIENPERKQILNRTNRMVNNQFLENRNSYIQIDLKSHCDSFVARLSSLTSCHSFSAASHRTLWKCRIKANRIKRMDSKTNYVKNSFDSISCDIGCFRMKGISLFSVLKNCVFYSWLLFAKHAWAYERNERHINRSAAKVKYTFIGAHNGSTLNLNSKQMMKS